MKRILSVLAVGIFQWAIAQDGAPASPYYDDFDFGQSGTALKSDLADWITVTHTNPLTYSMVWEALKETDLNPANASQVFLLYGWESGSDSDVTNDHNRNKDNNGGSNGQWNREHTFAQALGQPELGQIGPGADAHHLRACDVQRNNSRGNLKFATGSGTSSGPVTGGWYPGDEWKGDVARMILYMYLRYGDQCRPNYVSTGTAVSTDTNLPQLLLQWNADDPVSQYEDNRNTYLGSTSNTYGQGNRNPFIDNPYLATLIWGGPVAQNRWPFLNVQDVSWTQTLSVYPMPAHDQVTLTSGIPIRAVEIYSVNGQLLQRIIPTANQIDTSSLSTGFYLMRILTDQGETTRKLIKE